VDGSSVFGSNGWYNNRHQVQLWMVLVCLVAIVVLITGIQYDIVVYGSGGWYKLLFQL
jgi:hypothetical protein